MFIMQMSQPLSHDLMTADWLFLRLFNADFFCNVRLLQVFLREVLVEMKFCSVRVKKLIKVGLSEGGGVQRDFPLKEGGALIINVITKKKHCVGMCVLNVFQDLFVSCLKVLVSVGTKYKSLLRTDKSFSVNV